MINNSSQLRCYTIGHSDYPLDVLLYFLKIFDINCIVDVRSAPYSRRSPQYNRETLKDALNKKFIEYKFRGDQLGGRYTNPSLLFPDGTVNYNKVSELPIFQEGIAELISIIKQGKNIALMCSEKEPERCHRFALVSRHLQRHGVVIEHICPDIATQPNQKLEQELLHVYLDNSQRAISDSPVDALDALYEKINKKIAYKAPQSNPSQQDTYHDKQFKTALEMRDSTIREPGPNLDSKNISQRDGNINSNSERKKENRQQTLF